MNSDTSVSNSILIKNFHFPRTVISRFVARRTVRSAILWSLVFGGYVASKAIGFVDLYPTPAARQRIAETFSNNVGIELILGKAPHAATTASYVAWNTGSAMVIIGAIWGLLLATKYFRGEEDSGRWEIMLSGQTTARRAAANVFAGLGVSLAVFYVILAGLFVLIGKSHGVDFNLSSSLFFAFSVILGIILFILIGSLASQLMPTRSRAISISAIILGACFLTRAIGDITNMHWLLNLTPLGWVEKLQPLSNSQPLWLLPFFCLIVGLSLLTIFFAGKRDLGESIFADKATLKPHFKLLKSPFGAAVRLTRSNSIGWLSGIFIAAILYGLITKSTAQAFSQSKGFEKVVTKLAQQSRISSALAFLGIVFFLQMVIIMLYAASSVVAIRRDEAEGYIENFLVRTVSRFRWLIGRLAIVGLVILLGGLLTTFGTWAAIINQHTGISFHTLLLAGINALIPAVITVGVGIFIFGITPRVTSFMAYGVLAWSFLVEMVGTGLNLNHWILDTSILHQIALAPATNPDWKSVMVIVFISMILCLSGAIIFNIRDLTSE